MTKAEAISAVRKRCAERNFSTQTEKTYVHWIARYCDWKRGNASGGISDYLNFLAPQVAAKTQAQALNALLFFYKQVLGKEVGKLDFRYAEKAPRVPVCLSHSECHRLFGQMSGLPQLQAQLMYGAGLRVSEMLALRIKDLDFENRAIVVRGGKGDKDRTVPLPQSLVEQLNEQIEKARHWWEVDRDAENPPPYLPASLVRKLGDQVTELEWFWLFPASRLSTCPRSKIVRRHHLTDRGVAKAIARAARRAKIGKRVTPHVLRHSFATAMLINGLDIKSLSVLLGHKTTKTTERYLHAVPGLTDRVVSPLDVAPSNVVPISSPHQSNPDHRTNERNVS